MARSDHSDRTKAERIERLKQRMGEQPSNNPAAEVLKLRGILKGILDLLADEL